ncbi:uncharacterized protein EI97DRAFT_435031 [Westerdykella ornata]|uniref:T6SS Phospholipase effector Tle1-like catalytic domain-containing protein n=1 Tax=Westerdykella ornata TaxID=318751 RepID=A0A6A6JDY3_WESOR|nr:uncharacterized protein EI97DRAFT_435031 [Westerdykella ornata]KAF2274485.1 hypothetical protein EI97DRAFT_435031 [Westerdykella ornata]
MDEKPHRGLYPIQNADYSSQYANPPTNVQETTGFPRSIRALRDARNSDYHGRTVVICLDGTGDRFDNDNSNVVHFVSCLKKHSPHEQVTYYQSGIGTYDKGGLKGGLGAALDMTVGSGLGMHIKDAYRFLMQSYREGDKICLLGFSRGAYAVRCLAGMLHKVGLLPASNGAQVNFAYDFYKDDTPQGWKMSAEFKKTFCTNVDVYFVGLWDCVASVGFFPRKLPFSKTPTNHIHYFRHAMALDEHRSKFKVCQWQHQDPDLNRRVTIDHTPRAQLKRGLKRTGFLKAVGKSKPATVSIDLSAPRNGYTTVTNGSHGEQGCSVKTKTHEEDEQEELAAYFEAIDFARTHRQQKTDALEVWFKGCHADIGGGAVANETRHMLSRIPLRWMVRQCFECDTGIAFDVAALAEIGLDVHNLWPKYTPMRKPPIGPSPSLVEKYFNKSFPPIHRRSLFLRFEDDDKEADKLPGDHHIAHLSECTEDYFDSQQDVNDMLDQAKWWWILELWPVKVRLLAPDGDCWEKRVRMNRGRYRAIRETTPKFHWTVERLVEEGKYEIKGRVERDAHWEAAV